METAVGADGQKQAASTSPDEGRGTKAGHVPGPASPAWMLYWLAAEVMSSTQEGCRRARGPGERETAWP